MKNEDLIEFAKDQCEISLEDSYMGKYLRETIKMLEDELTLSKKIKQVREEIDTDVRTTVKHFTNTDTVIDYVLDSIDELIESAENGMREKRVFNLISNFVRANAVKIDFDFDFLGNLTITMTRKSHTISRAISRAISNSEFNWIEDCENTIFYYLNVMLAELIKSEEEK